MPVMANVRLSFFILFLVSFKYDLAFYSQNNMCLSGMNKGEYHEYRNQGMLYECMEEILLWQRATHCLVLSQ